MSDDLDNKPVLQPDGSLENVYLHNANPELLEKMDIVVTGWVAVGMKDGHVMAIYGPFQDPQEAIGWLAAVSNPEGAEIHVHPVLIQRRVAEHWENNKSAGTSSDDPADPNAAPSGGNEFLN